MAANPKAKTQLVVVQPQPSRSRKLAKRAGSAAARTAAKAAAQERHTLAALAAAAIAGAARRYDWQLPTIGDMPPTLTWGLGAWAFGRWGKNKMAQHVATGLLSVGLYDAIAYTQETRDQLDELLRIQRDAEEAERSTSGPSILGPQQGNFDND